MLGRIDVGHRPAARHARYTVAEQVPAGDQDARRPRSTDELVRRQDDRIQRCEFVAVGRRHLDLHVRRRGGVVPARHRPVSVQQPGDLRDIAEDPRHVRGGREAPDLHRPVGVAFQRLLQCVEIDPPVVVFGNRDEVGDRFAPGQFVRMVLVRADEHDRPFGLRDPRSQIEPVVEARRDPELETIDQGVQRAGRARPAEEDDVLVRIGMHGLADDGAGILTEPGGLQSRTARFGVGVGVQRQDGVADDVFDERQGPSRSRVVGVRDPTQPEGGGDRFVLADHRRADRLDQPGVGHGSHGTPERTKDRPEGRSSRGARWFGPQPRATAVIRFESRSLRNASRSIRRTRSPDRPSTLPVSRRLSGWPFSRP